MCYISGMVIHGLLIVEDEPNQLRRLVNLFKDAYTVYPAKTGAEAIALFKLHSFDLDLIILDINLPDMSAFQVLNAFEKICFAGVPPTIIQTSYQDEGWIESMLGEYRALAYLMKPFSDEDIEACMKTVLQADPLVFKWTHTEEHTRVMVLINHIRDYLFRKVDLMEEPQKSHVMPSVVELFQVYGGRESEDTHIKFKLKNSLKPILDLVSSVSLFTFPEADLVKIGFLGSSELENMVQESLLQKEGLLFEFGRISTHTPNGLLGYDFILVDLDSELPSVIATLHQSSKDNSEMLGPYIIGLTLGVEHGVLEEGIRNGMLLGLHREEAIRKHLHDRLVRFAQRRNEIRALEYVVEYIV